MARMKKTEMPEIKISRTVNVMTVKAIIFDAETMTGHEKDITIYGTPEKVSKEEAKSWVPENVVMIKEITIAQKLFTWVFSDIADKAVISDGRGNKGGDVE